MIPLMAIGPAQEVFGTVLWGNAANRQTIAICYIRQRHKLGAIAGVVEATEKFPRPIGFAARSPSYRRSKR